MTKKKRVLYRLAAILLIVAVIAGLMMALRGAKQKMAAAPEWKPRPVPLETAVIREGVLSRTIRYLGRLEALSTAEIAPKISARVLSLHADQGDAVAAGDILARLDDRNIRAQIAAAEANINAAKARLIGARAAATAARSSLSFLEREYERYKTLFEKKGISESAMEASRNRLYEARGRAVQAEQSIRSVQKEIAALTAQLTEADARLADTEIRAEQSGTIENRHAEVGDMTMPGKPLFTLMDVSSCRLAFNLVQEDLKWIGPGRPVRLSGPVAEEQPEPSVSRIFPSLESDQTVRAEIDLPGGCPEQLRVGSLLPMEVVVKKGTGLIVPRAALVPAPKDAGYQVYAVRENRLVSVPVQVEIEHGGQALIAGALAAGESVAVGEYLQWIRLHRAMDATP